MTATEKVTGAANALRIIARKIVSETLRKQVEDVEDRLREAVQSMRAAAEGAKHRGGQP